MTIAEIAQDCLSEMAQGRSAKSAMKRFAQLVAGVEGEVEESAVRDLLEMLAAGEVEPVPPAEPTKPTKAKKA